MHLVIHSATYPELGYCSETKPNKVRMADQSKRPKRIPAFHVRSLPVTNGRHDGEEEPRGSW